MLLRIARAALFAVVPAELLVVVLLVAGISVPGPLAALAEVAVAAVSVLVAAVACRLFRAARRGGADRRTALRATVDRLVPEQVRRIMAFDLKGMISLVLWVTRRRDGVPPGATAVSYWREQLSTLLLFLFAMAVETAGLDLLLRGLDAPAGLRTVILVIDLYGLLFGVAVGAGYVTRPHVVTAGELRIRSGAFFDLRVPRERIAAVRLVRNFNEDGMVKVENELLTVAVTAQTNVIVELTEPITVVRPLGRRAEARTIRFFADTPKAVLDALAPTDDRSEIKGVTPSRPAAPG